MHKYIGIPEYQAASIRAGISEKIKVTKTAKSKNIIPLEQEETQAFIINLNEIIKRTKSSGLINKEKPQSDIPVVKTLYGIKIEQKPAKQAKRFSKKLSIFFKDKSKRIRLITAKGINVSYK